MLLRVYGAPVSLTHDALSGCWGRRVKLVHKWSFMGAAPFKNVVPFGGLANTPNRGEVYPLAYSEVLARRDLQL